MHQEVLPTDDWDGMMYENIWKITKKNFSDYMKFYTTFMKVNYMHNNAKSLHRDNMKYEDSTKWGTKTWGQCFALRLSHSPNPLLPGQ